MQGTYEVKKWVGKVDYEVMFDKRKRRIFHVNMLKKWVVLGVSTYYAGSEAEEHGEDDVCWMGMMRLQEGSPALVSNWVVVSRKNCRGYCVVLRYDAEQAWKNLPRKHHIVTQFARPLRQPLYHLPRAYQEEVFKELEEMEW